jgi:hypothetical protein
MLDRTRYVLAFAALCLSSVRLHAAEHAPWLTASRDAAPLVGVQVKLPSFTDRDAQQIRRTGLQFVRLGIWTDRMDQPAYRRSFAQAIATAQAAQLPVLLTVRSLKPLVPADTPSDARVAAIAEAGFKWAKVITQISDEYGQQLLAIELWNEPDLHQYWPTGNVEDTFVPFMRAVCERLGKHHPAVPVIGFAFSRAPLTGSAPERLLRPLAASMPGCVDAISYHAYGMSPAQIRTAAQALHARYGLPAVITEAGAASVGSGGLNRQAQRLATLLDALNDLSTPLISIYEWADTSHAPDVAQRHYGLVQADRTAKPARGAVAQALHENRSRHASRKASNTRLHP